MKNIMAILVSALFLSSYAIADESSTETQLKSSKNVSAVQIHNKYETIHISAKNVNGVLVKLKKQTSVTGDCYDNFNEAYISTDLAILSGSTDKRTGEGTNWHTDYIVDVNLTFTEMPLYCKAKRVELESEMKFKSFKSESMKDSKGEVNISLLIPSGYTIEAEEL